MISKAKRHEEAAELRGKAEETAREKAAPSSESLDALSPEETRQMLHELRVHQIELEIQNEDLRRTQVELDAARARYFDLYDLAPVGYCTLSEMGLILEANLTAAMLLGSTRSMLIKHPISRFIHKADQDIYYQHRKQLFDTGEPQICELRMVKPDGTAFWVHLKAIIAPDPDGTPVCRIVMSDISERKFHEDELELTARLIALIKTPGDFRECMSDLVASLQGWSGCEAVGIRLRAGDDYPYYETRGFPPEFVQAENHLCAHGPDGKILRDGIGNPVLECMCGNILCGRFDPAKPFFTAQGSFWSNNTTALLASTTEADRQARTRNQYNGMGYESVALIPLRADDQVFGLLQFNDHRPNRFTPDLMSHFEKIADNLAIALSKRQAEKALRESEAQFRTIFEVASVGILQADPITGRILRCNETYCRITGYPLSELLEISFSELTHPEDRQRDWEIFSRAACGEMPVYFNEKRYIRKDGGMIWVRLNAAFVRNSKGQPIRTVAICEDISERKRAGAYGEMGREVLQILNEPRDLRDSIQRVLTALKKRTGVDAVGIRLQNGDNFPYFVQKGFSRDFLMTENTLIEHSADGGVCRDKDGNISLECTCGLVISGKTDPANPLFTPGGSFWTNDSFPLLDIPPNEDPRLHPRNRCIHQGYASIALVPIRNKDRNVGLIQLNDRQKGRFTLDTVELLEGIASHIGAALMRKRVEESLRESEEALRTSLAEKEVLLKEVHHRVKNNLASIMGLLDLQGQTMESEPAITALAELSVRIRSMVLVHEQLYQSENFSRIDFQDYLNALIANLLLSYERSGDIQVSVAAKGVEMGLDIAVPCGLLVTELLTNALKYAFPADRPRPGACGCKIAVSAECDGAAYTLVVSDNGVGLPVDLDWANTKTLGLLLVKMLGQHQLQGKIELDRTHGTTFRLRFTARDRNMSGDNL
ncbi:MAG: PAS domain S-box protein [Deltaproteobacteria bacterium]|nr:PAS domain S-box protein [Deltaproteobacteria bacterium]